MKKVCFLVFCIAAVSFSVSAQSFYFDGGVGTGIGIVVTEKGFPNSWVLGYDYEIRAGYGPIGNSSMFAVADIGYVLLGPFFFGAGALYYPIGLIQLGASLGGLLMPAYVTGKTTGGFGWRISAAFDLGKQNKGYLLGLQYYGGIYPLMDTYWSQFLHNQSHVLGIFVRFAFRENPWL